MFKKSSESVQFSLFTSPKSLFSGKSLKLYENKSAWHNQFRQQVTMRVDESFFSPLYCADNGTPNAPVRVLIAMMVLKEAEGLSDQKLFENCRFNMLTRGAIGLLNADDSVPTESTYYLFRERVNEYAKAGNENLFDVIFADITKSQCIDFEVSGKRIRMDSKLLGSNIAWLSRYDTDCHRNKDGNKVKGYSINVTESCDDKGLNLIGHVDVRKVSTSDVEFLQDDIKKVQEVFPDKTEAAHADGAYHSPDNQMFRENKDINLYLHAIQGAKGRYKFNLLENGELSVFDTNTNGLIAAPKVTCKNNIDKWRIKIEKGYRYFTRKEIDTYLIRKQIEETPIETLQIRNNVEATIFQLAYHYSNAKSRYRGLIKHQMWANIRCLLVNFVRILNYIKQLCQRTSFFAKYALKSLFTELYFAFKSFLTAILPNHLSHSENIKFSIS